MPRYIVTFEVGQDQACWWKVDADNEYRAKVEAAQRFVNDPVWSNKYPTSLPPCTIELVHEPEGQRRRY